MANEITILARDLVTGEVFERKLPVTIKENQLGIWLEGKDEFGDSQALVFLTEIGLQELSENFSVETTRLEEKV